MILMWSVQPRCGPSPQPDERFSSACLGYDLSIYFFIRDLLKVPSLSIAIELQKRQLLKTFLPPWAHAMDVIYYIPYGAESWILKVECTTTRKPQRPANRFLILTIEFAFMSSGVIPSCLSESESTKKSPERSVEQHVYAANVGYRPHLSIYHLLTHQRDKEECKRAYIDWCFKTTSSTHHTPYCAGLRWWITADWFENPFR